MEYKRESKNGIMDYEVIAWQTKSALEILEAENADKILKAVEEMGEKAYIIGKITANEDKEVEVCLK